MSSKAKKPVNTPVKPAGEAPDPAPWRPEMETDSEFNPFASAGVSGDGRTQFGERGQEPEPVGGAPEDTAPLQGTRDRSDADSLREPDAAGARAQPRRRASRVRRRPARKATRVTGKAKGSAARAKSKSRTKTKAKRSAAKTRGKSRLRGAKTAKRLTRRGRPSRSAKHR
jgi:hypothetical protein